MELDELMRVRSHLREAAGQLLLGGGAKLTYLPFVVKALSATLASHPEVNMQMAPGGRELLQLAGHNVGVAMATGGGLVVPNVKAVRAKAAGAEWRDRAAAGAGARPWRLSWGGTYCKQAVRHSREVGDADRAQVPATS
jgi:hypothetical protein